MAGKVFAFGDAAVLGRVQVMAYRHEAGASHIWGIRLVFGGMKGHARFSRGP
jgi:hypothetical protein